MKAIEFFVAQVNPTTPLLVTVCRGALLDNNEKETSVGKMPRIQSNAVDALGSSRALRLDPIPWYLVNACDIRNKERQVVMQF